MVLDLYAYFRTHWGYTQIPSAFTPFIAAVHPAYHAYTHTAHGHRNKTKCTPQNKTETKTLHTHRMHRRH